MQPSTKSFEATILKSWLFNDLQLCLILQGYCPRTGEDVVSLAVIVV